MYHSVPRIAAVIAIGGAVLLSARGAEAHLAGASQSDFALVDATHARATVTFARADAAVLAPGGEPDFRALAASGIDVRADGDACAGVLEGVAATGGDGVEVQAGFTCPHPPGLLDVSLPLLDILPAGHVDQVHITASGRSIDAVLRSSGQHAELKTGNEPPLIRVAAGASAAAAGLLLVALAWWWQRRTKRER